MDRRDVAPASSSRSSKTPRRLREVLNDLLSQAQRSPTRADFVREVCVQLLLFTGVDQLSLRLDESGKVLRCRAMLGDGGQVRVEVTGPEPAGDEAVEGSAGLDPIPEPVVQAILAGRFRSTTASFTRGRSFWTGDAAHPILLREPGDSDATGRTMVLGGELLSQALIPVPLGEPSRGVLFLGSRRREAFVRSDIQSFEAVAEALGVALTHQRTQWALRERVKEMTCLYGIGKVAQQAAVGIDELMQRAVELLPPGWQYPEITCARIALDGRSFTTQGFEQGSARQSAPITIDGRLRGQVEVTYTRPMPELDEGPFLVEERNLINAVAETLGVVVARHETQLALRERVKELSCLYGIGRMAQQGWLSIDELLQRVVALLPPGWQYPEITCARIVLDGRAVTTEGYEPSPFRQSAPIVMDGEPRGEVEVCYARPMPELDEGPFLVEERNLINAVAETLGGMLAHHETQCALRERVKELTCLYGIAKVASRSGLTLEELLQGIVEVLPPGWQYPAITEARIVLDGRSFATAGFVETSFVQRASIQFDGVTRGTVEVTYTREMPEIDEGPFLKEERSLINEVARQVGFSVEHWEMEAEQARLQEQLRHAERLAMVGQLSAGVAHELNEPLGAVLGFAELVKSNAHLPDQAGQDVDKIIQAALHAREVIRSLMLFTRQLPARMQMSDLNEVVTKGLYFLEARCAKEGIELVRELQPGLPSIKADPSQLHQVLFNLVANAIRATRTDRRLTIRTSHAGGFVSLIVEDSGVGMTEEVQQKMFLPFFTTMDVGEGTGLGLSVVHGIVTAHGGTIHVASELGRGSTVEVRLPAAAEATLEEED